jgi:hypothetical protein
LKQFDCILHRSRTFALFQDSKNSNFIRKITNFSK